MTIKKKPHSAEFKFKVALESVKNDRTISDLCQEFGIVSSQIYKWRKDLLNRGSDVFNGSKSGNSTVNEGEIEKLHATIGKLKVENDFLEKVLRRSR